MGHLWGYECCSSHSLIKGLFCVYICCYTVHTKYLLLLKLAIPARLRKLLIRSAFKTQSQISHFVKYKIAGHCSSLVQSPPLSNEVSQRLRNVKFIGIGSHAVQYFSGHSLVLEFLHVHCRCFI